MDYKISNIMSKQMFMLLFIMLILNMSTRLNAQYYDIYNQRSSLLFQISFNDSIRMLNDYRLYISTPTNNADSIINYIQNLDTVLLCRKMKLVKQVFFDDEFKIRYGFVDNNAKYIETIYSYSNNTICIKTVNPHKLNSSNDYLFFDKLNDEYSICDGRNDTALIDRKVFEKSTITIVKSENTTKRFPIIYITHIDGILFCIDFLEAIYY